ncbi:MAG: 3-deoxy-D-manno-octulosonic acid transferase [Flavobacteriales bacterium]|nr:3-deoxy-D-manno-octulosonic acid transferase [Flavobacteriales bacterium]
MLSIYNIIIKFFGFAIKIHSLYNQKSHQWIDGRKDIFFRLEKEITNNKNIVWFHCASHGEYEQVNQLISKYKNNFPQDKILLTFFSPSGFNNIKKNNCIDWIFYLPLDTQKNAKKFIKLVMPKKVFFVKSEFWYNYMNQLNLYKIPLYHVSCIFDKEKFSIFSSFSTKILSKSKHFFVQDKNSLDVLNSINIKNSSITGDTRFDSILENIKNKKEDHRILEFCLNKTTIIFASVWPEDEHVFKKFIKENSQYRFIIAPHELNYCKNISELFDVELYSEFDTPSEKNILLINKIGILKNIYKYCSLAYIGGGFGKGIHNIIEASANLKPVVFGPNHSQFIEAKDLIKINGAASVNNYKEFLSQFNKLNSSFNKKAVSDYIKDKSGATDKIIQHLKV